MVKMNKRGLHLIILCLCGWLAAQAQTLDECQEMAENNYPLIRRYGLIQQTTDLTVANINKGWLPQISAYAQGTVQNRVVKMPDALTTMMAQQGYDIKGLMKEQYKVGVDVSQTIYDGGRMKLQKDVARRQGEVERAQNEVSLYAVRQRVNELYFGILLVEDKMQLNRDLQKLLLSSEQQLTAMVKSGTAATSDLNAVKAERLNAEQQMVELESQRESLSRVLELFIGREFAAATRPVEPSSYATAYNNRPELAQLNEQLSLIDAQERALNAQLRPTLGAFAQGYYGYPGYNMYKDMFSRTPTFNAMAGVKLSWSIGALYTRKNDKAKLRVQREQVENQREVFNFNNQVEQVQENENISKYRKLAMQDGEIIALRSQVRMAAESKLAHGIIDVNDLVKEINNENAAKLQQSIHEVELLKAVYDLKYTVNDKENK